WDNEYVNGNYESSNENSYYSTRTINNSSNKYGNNQQDQQRNNRSYSKNNHSSSQHQTLKTNSNVMSQSMNHTNERTTNDQIHISSHALSYAVESHLPSFKLECDPKLQQQQQDGTVLVKELFKLIENDFRKNNKDYKKPLRFDYWYIDQQGDLICFVKQVELFVYFCDISHYPGKINDCEIKPLLPKKLPPQYSIIIKFVNNNLSVQDIKEELTTSYSSIYIIEELNGSKSNKNRHVRVDMKSKEDYNKIMNGSVVITHGQCFNVNEFLQVPKLLLCSRCNGPGHIKKICKSPMEICRRYGKNRRDGEDHTECVVKCHYCQGERISTNYQYPVLADYRFKLVTEL
ncbi:unnamed protein product, partial [Didymodactylos carnosus]